MKGELKEEGTKPGERALCLAEKGGNVIEELTKKKRGPGGGGPEKRGWGVRELLTRGEGRKPFEGCH